MRFLHDSPSVKIHFHVKVIHKKFGDILLIFRGCSTESKFYISMYYYCENKKIVFLHLNFLQVLPSRKVHFHVKVIHKKFGDILLIVRGCSTESKFYISIYYYCEKKKIFFFHLNFFQVSPLRQFHFHFK